MRSDRRKKKSEVTTFKGVSLDLSEKNEGSKEIPPFVATLGKSGGWLTAIITTVTILRFVSLRTTTWIYH